MTLEAEMWRSVCDFGQFGNSLNFSFLSVLKMMTTGTPQVNEGHTVNA